MRREVEIESDIADHLEIREHPGWVGVFTRQRAKGAWKNGSRVTKVAEDPSGDLTPLGSQGQVLGSVGFPEIGHGYFIEWDNHPRRAVFCVAAKLELVP